MFKFGVAQFSLVCVFTVVLSAQQPQGWLSNLRVAELVQSGVNTEEIIRMISVAPKVQFDLRPVSTDALLKAGVSEDIIKAMSAREMGSGPLVMAAQPSTRPAHIPTDLESQPSLGNKASIKAPAEFPATPSNIPANAGYQPDIPAAVRPTNATARVPPTLPTPYLPAPPSEAPLGLLTDEQVDQAIREGLTSRRSIGLRLNDIQTSVLTTIACHTCSQSGYTVYIYTPEEWIALAAQHARREMLPYSVADVPDDMRRPMLHVVAYPSTPEYLNGAGFSLASSVHRIVLSDTTRQTIIQPLEVHKGSVELNSALRSASFGTGSASFLMDDVRRLRAGDLKREFFVVVVGDNQNKFFKVKAKYQKQLFGTR